MFDSVRNTCLTLALLAVSSVTLGTMMKAIATATGQSGGQVVITTPIAK